MSLKEELEDNVSKIVGFLKELTKGALDFFYPNDVSSPDLNINLPDESLLSGEYFYKAWDRHFSDKEVKPAYGIYFIFVRDKDLLIPLYIGKGRLPSRCLSHFSRTQYIDMLLSGHFGGVPRNPKLLENDSKRQEQVKEALGDFEIGFLLSKPSNARDLEGKFINCLIPLANNEIYRKITKTPPYSIQELIFLWEDAKRLFQGSSHPTLPDLEELKKSHEEILKRPQKPPSP